ncbi:MAG: MoaD/ThiS family protein [Candidatus Eisenbacteria bacterium]|nr:MoaD/ThiS family protein [Candidatus Eisenbacteria bacterium]
MNIRVLCFAGLRERLGRSDFPKEVPAGSTPRSVLLGLLGDADAARAAGVAYAVNLQHVAADHELREGDQVAFLPPVSGG